MSSLVMAMKMNLNLMDGVFDKYLDGSDFGWDNSDNDSTILLPTTDYLSIYSKSNESTNLNNVRPSETPKGLLTKGAR